MYMVVITAKDIVFAFIYFGILDSIKIRKHAKFKNTKFKNVKVNKT